jgi:hypothetical protein
LDSNQLFNARFLVSDTQFPLDQLNRMDLPPTDPRFISLSGYIPDGTTLGPGQFAQAPVPEPSSIALLGLGTIGLLGYTWRCRKQAAA